MNDGREYRYQKDWSFGDIMLHVRCDNFDEFVIAVENMDTMLPKRDKFPDDEIGKPMATPESKVEPQTTPLCPKGHGPMKYRSGVSQKTGKPYGFWSCPHKNPDGTWCGEKK